MKQEMTIAVIDTQTPTTYPPATEQNAATEEWTLIIRPQRHLFDLRLGELWQARDLVQLFVWRDFVAGYKQAILGPLWYLIQPLLTTITSIMGFENSHLWSPNAGQTNV
jgi:lipopolysaccharide transport system permease protein